MRAVVLTGTGGPEKMVVRDLPDPGPGPGEVAVSVRAAGINFAELLARQGLYPDAPDTPCVLGYEFAGDVSALGSGVTGLEVGDRVFGPILFGGQAETVVVPADQAMPIPEGFGYAQAAALPVNYCTAIAAMVEMGGLRDGGRLVMFGVSELEGSRGFLSRQAIGALLKMPLATSPWWKSLAMIGENKVVGGLNLLDW
jgi:NADPH:quinone reductase-like Zn-dependent oxidoreductase